MENEYTTPHMVAMQNIQIFAVSDEMNESKLRYYMQTLVDEVRDEKHVPHYYINAYNAIKSNKGIDMLDAYKKDKEREPWDEDGDDLNNPMYMSPIKHEFIVIILEYLEQCIQISVENFPEQSQIFNE